MKIFLVLISLSVLSPTVVVATTGVAHDAPENVQVFGVIEQQTFPGRPEYHSIKAGDEVERGWYLRLPVAIDVQLAKNNADGNAEPEVGVRVLQLTWAGKAVEAVIRRSVGQRLKLVGHLFHGFNGHHHTRVLMWVDGAERERK